MNKIITTIKKNALLQFLLFIILIALAVFGRIYFESFFTYESCVNNAFKDSLKNDDIIDHLYVKEIQEIRDGIYELKREECSLYYKKAFSGSILESIQNTDDRDLNNYILNHL